jgi:UDP-glucose 4-epimerase
VTVLLTGGTGYIGANVAVALVQAGRSVVLLDDLSNSEVTSADAIQRITGVHVPLVIGDARDESLVARTIVRYGATSVVHLAGRKSPVESLEFPLAYYDHNVGSLVATLRAAHASGVREFVFSSSATVYGDAESPIDESTPINPVTPYGRTKAMCEQVLQDYAFANPDRSVVALRYFNPVGAHKSGLLGERPMGMPTNLMPAALRVARGVVPALFVYGDDYSTPDGTALRDYVHVSDLADGHVAALEARPGYWVYNLGTGTPSSVLEVLTALSGASGRVIPIRARDRRDGDVAVSYCNPAAAKRGLGWRATRTLDDAARDAWLAYQH